MTFDMAFEYGNLVNDDEAQQLGRILAQCFNDALEESEPYMSRVGLENFRVVRQAGRVAGGLAMLKMGQWWGKQAVPMTDIASVGIAPEFRGSGAAATLMQFTIREMYAQGVSLSVLYAAVQRLYRKVGYEQGGTACGWEVPTAAIQTKTRPLPVHAVPTDSEIFRQVYQQQARSINGFLDRNAAIWRMILEPEAKETVYAYCFGALDQPQGYIIFQHQRDQDDILIVRDRALLSVEARQTFWAFLSDHRSLIEKVWWKAGAIDDLTLLLPEQSAKQRFIDRWLLRIINVSDALEQRGYPPHLQTELHLDIRDDLIAENNGRLVLSIAEGKGRVTRGGKGEVKLDIRGLAPLYTGLFTPAQLQLAGMLEAIGSSLTNPFCSGESPWMPDFF